MLRMELLAIWEVCFQVLVLGTIFLKEAVFSLDSVLLISVGWWVRNFGATLRDEVHDIHMYRVQISSHIICLYHACTYGYHPTYISCPYPPCPYTYPFSLTSFCYLWHPSLNLYLHAPSSYSYHYTTHLTHSFIIPIAHPWTYPFLTDYFFSPHFLSLPTTNPMPAFFPHHHSHPSPCLHSSPPRLHYFIPMHTINSSNTHRIHHVHLSTSYTFHTHHHFLVPTKLAHRLRHFIPSHHVSDVEEEPQVCIGTETVGKSIP